MCWSSNLSYFISINFSQHSFAHTQFLPPLPPPPPPSPLKKMLHVWTDLVGYSGCGCWLWRSDTLGMNSVRISWTSWNRHVPGSHPSGGSSCASLSQAANRSVCYSVWGKQNTTGLQNHVETLYYIYIIYIVCQSIRHCSIIINMSINQFVTIV